MKIPLLKSSIRLISLFIFIDAATCFSQTSSMDDLSLEELLEIDITVASKSASTIQESPGIISLITKNDIINSGARELTDILELISGFQFAQDVQNAIGIGLRGNWVHEGKVLLQLDGVTMNDLLYGNPTIGNRISVDNIERIEIIRGPGSVQHGGFAGMGVINIITSKKIHHAQASTSIGMMSNGSLRKSFAAQCNFAIDETNFFLNAYSLSGVQSDIELYSKDTSDNTSIYASKDISTFNSHFFNLDINNNRFSAKIAGELYQLGTPVNSQRMLTKFSGINSQIGYDFLFGNISLKPRFGYISQIPWQTSDPIAINNDYYLSLQVERYTVSIPCDYTVSENLLIASGIDFWLDEGTATNDDSTYWFTFQNSQKKIVDFTNIALFLQGEWKSDLFNLTAGLRFENNSSFGSAFVPRLALTKVFDSWHFKTLFSRAYRAPSIMNITTAEDGPIKPEIMSVLELEVGYKITPNVLLTTNFFLQRIDNPIIFYFTSFVGSFRNHDHTGTIGFESELRWIKSNITGWVNYSFYASYKSDVDEFQPTNTILPSNQFLGFANHSASLFLSYSPLPQLSITPSAKFTSQYYGFDYPLTGDAEESIKRFDAFLWGNISLLYRITNYNLGISLTCSNVFNNNRPIVQPYITESDDTPISLPALPSASREFVLRVIYTPKW